MTKVYLGMTADFFHHGHANIINKASEYGDVTIGLLTDNAVVEHKRLPFLNYEQRKKILVAIKGVVDVIPQDEWDYAPNILRIKPDIMIHGDDWLEGPLMPLREKAINALKTYGGRLVEVSYTKDISSEHYANEIKRYVTTADVRRGSLKRILKSKQLARFMEAHSPISALVVENASISLDGAVKQFDGFWSSSLTDSIEMGKPDIEALDISKRLVNVNDIFDVTTKPLIMDVDTGGMLEHFEINVKTIERVGVSAIIVEDKIGLKRNSLFGTEADQQQDEIENFCKKMSAGRNAKQSDDFLIIARIESLILERGMKDALTRADAYIASGADGIMIHSRRESPNEILEFAKLFRDKHKWIPLVCVPTAYNSIYESELAKAGFNMVIYANQLMRASYPAMQNIAHEILRYGRAHEIESSILSISDVLKVIPRN